jgi:hypothetical protein
MAHRTFRDEAGDEWQVWDTYPSTKSRSTVAPAYVTGWLAFQRVVAPNDDAGQRAAERERRRLVPVPRGWDSLDDPHLAALLQSAVAPRARAG